MGTFSRALQNACAQLQSKLEMTKICYTTANPEFLKLNI